MPLQLSQRQLAAGAIVVIAIAGAMLAGEALWAVLLGLIGGAAAVLIGWRAYFFPDPPPPPPPSTTAATYGPAKSSAPCRSRCC